MHLEQIRIMYVCGFSVAQKWYTDTDSLEIIASWKKERKIAEHILIYDQNDDISVDTPTATSNLV